MQRIPHLDSAMPLRMEVSEFFPDDDDTLDPLPVDVAHPSESPLPPHHAVAMDANQDNWTAQQVPPHREEEEESNHDDNDDGVCGQQGPLPPKQTRTTSGVSPLVNSQGKASTGSSAIKSPSPGPGESSLKYMLPFPVSIYNQRSKQWHQTCFIQFWFTSSLSSSSEAEGSTATVVGQSLVLINDRPLEANVVASPELIPSWPFVTDRIFLPLQSITFLYDDDESEEVKSEAKYLRQFCGTLSAGLHCSLHPTDGFAHETVLDLPEADDVLSLLYLPQMLRPPLHVVHPNGSVEQDNDRCPVDATSGVPILDPFEERSLLIRCPSTKHKRDLLQKLVDALQSHYLSYVPRERRALMSPFETRRLYRHCVRRVFHMHFVRNLLLLGAMKHPGMYLSVWQHEPDEICFGRLLRQHTETGTFSKLLIKIRTMVSLKKVRYMEDGFNLDLAPITPNIIAMGFPSIGSQALMRNPIEEVLRYFEVYWGNHTWPVTKSSIKALVEKEDSAFARLDRAAMMAYVTSPVPIRYRIYNLCSERCYPPTRFAGSFERYPSDDHNPPPLAQMMAFCASAEAFLKGNDTKDVDHPGGLTGAGERVIAVHCKAGKGRTGVMIVALMLYMKLFDSLDAALRHYSVKRTRDGKGVTIASQIRFLRYFAHCLSEIGRRIPVRRSVRLRSISFSPIPWFDLDGGCTPFLQIRVRCADHWHVPLGQREVVATEDDTMSVIYTTEFVNGAGGEEAKLPSFVGGERAVIPIMHLVEVSDEVQFVFFNKGGRLLRTEYMFSFWLHTSFLDDRAAVTMLKRDEVDGASKEHREFFDPGFLVELEYLTQTPQP